MNEGKIKAEADMPDVPKKSKGKKYGIVVASAVVLLFVFIGISIYNTPANRLQRQLDLGQRYLKEQDYEQAVIEFDKAIAIDPMNADAYLGKADAYMGLGDEQAAYATLEAGYAATGDERIKEKLDEKKFDEFENRMREIAEYGISDERFLTYEQREAVYRPLVEELEMYLEQVLEGAYGERGRGYVFGLFSLIAGSYLQLGEMEKCLETRRRGYEITGEPYLMPDTWKNEYISGENRVVDTFDEYGRRIECRIEYEYSTSKSIIIYGEANRPVGMEGYLYGEDDRLAQQDEYEYEYDGLGRLMKLKAYGYSGFYQDGAYDTTEYVDEREYEYQDGQSVIETITMTTEESTDILISLITYNQYGTELERVDMTEAH